MGMSKVKRIDRALSDEKVLLTPEEVTPGHRSTR